MSVISISRELGSQGSLIAENAAHALGYHLADETTIETMLKGYGMVKFAQDYKSMPGFWDRLDAEKTEERETFLKMLNASLIALASHGDVVLVGRGVFAVLEGMADVLKVRIQAPLPLRIERTQEAPGNPEPGKAEALVKENDQTQRTFVKSVYGKQWDAADAFDLVIDTGLITPDLATSMIVDAARALPALRPDGAQVPGTIAVDPVLASTVQEVLNCRKEHLPSLRPEGWATSKISAGTV